VKNWFQAFAFKWVNLYRYTEVDVELAKLKAKKDAKTTKRIALLSVGLCTLNQVDP
jgi:hypothetical protein